MPKRLAITIAGAVSLGSYEAGVLYELLRAIRLNNEQAASEDNKIYIDVITGASAGAMTAAMVARKLMYNGVSLNDPVKNPLYQAWVEQISLLGLVRLRRKEKRWHSLFSSDLVAEIGQKMLVDSMGESSGTHPAIELIDGTPEPLRLGMALTNLNGVDYMIPILGIKEGGFNYTTSVDQKVFELAPNGIFELLPNGSQKKSGWTDLCATAVASGAFPVAFRPGAVEHDIAQYGIPLPANPNLWEEGQTYVDLRKRPSSTRVWFAHSDGGVLQNQPLGIAKNLVDMAVQARAARVGSTSHCDSEERLYVFVAPHSVKSTAKDLHAEEITIWDELKQLFSVYTRQAMFHDWITAETVNQKIFILDKRASDLAKAIAARAVNVVALQAAAANLNALLIPNNLTQRLARLKDQYRAEYATALEAGQPAADAFLQGIATLEAAAQLNEHDRMRIIAVIANAKTELMGGGLSSFVGFFNKKFREHDYWMGRVKARKYLLRKDVTDILGVTHWANEAELKTDLENPSGVKPPPSTWQLVKSAFWPAIIMVAIRPFLLAMLAILAVLMAAAVWALLHFHH